MLAVTKETANKPPKPWENCAIGLVSATDSYNDPRLRQGWGKQGAGSVELGASDSEHRHRPRRSGDGYSSVDENPTL